MTTLRRAVAEDAEALTELALLSKRSWGYDDEFMRRVEPDMLVSPDDIENGYCLIAEFEGTLAAYLLARMDGEEAFVRDLFVHPRCFNRGLGRLLFGEALQYAREQRAVRLRLDSDPNAQGFYEHLGMRCTGLVPSIVGNARTLPVMSLEIRAH